MNEFASGEVRIDRAADAWVSMGTILRLPIKVTRVVLDLVLPMDEKSFLSVLVSERD